MENFEDLDLNPNFNINKQKKKSVATINKLNEVTDNHENKQSVNCKINIKNKFNFEIYLIKNKQI